MGNTIPGRVADFLSTYPPFTLLKEKELLQIARRVTVQYRQPGAILFRQGEHPGAYFYLLREGAVHLLQEEDGERVLVDQCDEGDLFGIRALLAEERYDLTAEAVEESLLYAIPADEIEQVLQENPKVAYYLAASFASGRRGRGAKPFRGRIFLERERYGEGRLDLVEVQSLQHGKAPVVCLPATSIKRAAQIMTEEKVGSIIVVDMERYPLGIVTDKDLRREVATGKAGLDDPVSAIMSSPVITMPPSVTVADVQMEMVKNRVHHLCLTRKGTDQSEVIGVLSEHDILVVQSNNPAVMIREINRSTGAAGLRRVREHAEDLLKKYIYQEVSINFISTIMREVNDALIARANELAREELKAAGRPAPDVAFCWLALGSQGRGEQLLRTDQDSGLIFEKVAAADYNAVKHYFLDFARRVTQILFETGFEYCPAEMMASNPRWCLSVDEWKRQFGEWITEPTPQAVRHATIFFDYRPVYGREELAGELTAFIYDQLGNQSPFLTFLAKDALENPPPLTFFRNFVVEKSGEHQDAFDIKARAMMPLVDAARVLTMQARISRINNTLSRFEKLAEMEPQNRELYEEAAEAYEMLQRYRTLQGLKHGDTGRFFKPSELSKMERLNLRNSFRPIRDLQSLLNTRFQTAFFR